MEEENKEVEAQEVEQVTNEVENEGVGGDVAHIMRMAESDPAIKELPEYQELLKSADKVRQGGTETTSKEEEINEDVYEEEVTAETEEQEVEEDEDDSNPFGINKQKKSKSNLSFEDDSDVVEYMKKKYSIDDPAKFFESADKWRNQSQKASETEGKLKDLLDGLGSLPQPIKDAIDAFANAQDYRAAFTSSAPVMDFSKDANEVDKETMVKHYFKAKVEKQKTKLDEGEIYEEEYNEYIDDLYDSAARLFKSDKRDWERERAEIIRQENESAEALKSSAISSVDSLQKKYPNFSSNELKKVRTRLVQQDLRNLFFDRDGSYREDAAERLAFVLYGNKLMESLKNQAKAEAESAANATIVQRGKKQLVGSKSKSGTNKTEADNAIRHLTGQFGNDPYS